MSKRYTDQKKSKLIADVLLAMATNSVSQSCLKAGVPKSTFVDWTGNDKELAERYVCARLLYIDYLADQLMIIAMEEPKRNFKGDIDNGAVQDKRVRLDTIKWLLSKVASDQFGDRLQLANDKDNPLNFVAKVERIIINCNEAIKDKEINDYKEAGTLDSIEDKSE